MNHTTITPTDINIALVDLDKGKYAEVLEFIHAAKGNAPAIQPERKAFREQESLVADLNRLYSLVETARLAMLQINADDGEAVSDTLLLAAEMLFDLAERQKIKCEQLEAIAYPAAEEARQKIEGFLQGFAAEPVSKDGAA